MKVTNLRAPSFARAFLRRMVERFNSGNKLGAILGGSEEILADLGIKMAMKGYPHHARL
jgi:hypothetical protein